MSQILTNPFLSDGHADSGLRAVAGRRAVQLHLLPDRRHGQEQVPDRQVGLLLIITNYDYLMLNRVDYSFGFLRIQIRAHTCQ